MEQKKMRIVLDKKGLAHGRSSPVHHRVSARNLRGKSQLQKSTLSLLRDGRIFLSKQALNLASVTAWSIESSCLISPARVSPGNSPPPLTISISALSSPMQA